VFLEPVLIPGTGQYIRPTLVFADVQTYETSVASAIENILSKRFSTFINSLDNQILIFIPMTKITQHSITSALHHSSEDYKTTSVIKVRENSHHPPH
jgi:hypothetical protein